MANVLVVLGKSGTGKSTSIKTLNPDETIIVNVLGKRLPFKGSSSVYNKEKKNMFRLDDYNQVIKLLEQIDKLPNIKNVVIDDSIYILRKEYFARATQQGYSKYTELAQHFQQIISLCEKMREDINVFFILHSEDIVSDNTITSYKVATIGKLLDTQYNIMEVVPMLLYSSVKYDEEGNTIYGFYTHRTKEGSIEIPAKTPDGMFEEDFIPNDLELVVKAMNDYYA